VIDEAVHQLMDGFVASVRQIAAVEAIWVHGSLALGDSNSAGATSTS